MGKDERKGARRDRTQKTSKRVPKLGYYVVVTDTRATERNYLYGFRDSIPSSMRDRIVIKVSNAPTHELLAKCLEISATEPQYRKPWIVLDRDEVSNFDKIIDESKKQGVEVGWSNPCIEIWFQAYFGEMPVYQTSTQCNVGFGKTFKDNVGQAYDKASSDNYQKICRSGDERKAIELAESRYCQQCEICNKPSKMLSTTTLHHLISEIMEKIRTKE